MGLFRELAGQPVTAEQYPRLLDEAFRNDAPAVETRYPLSDYETPSVAWASVLTDRMWARPTFEQHGVLADRVPTYAYEFADRDAPMYLPFHKNLPPGAFHAAEVPYLFNDDKFAAGSTPEQRRLSTRMIRHWANFARSGDPNGPDLPPWRPFVSSEPHVLSLAPGADGIRPDDYATEHALDFWSGR